MKRNCGPDLYLSIHVFQCFDVLRLFDIGLQKRTMLLEWIKFCMFWRGRETIQLSLFSTSLFFLLENAYIPYSLWSENSIICPFRELCRDLFPKWSYLDTSCFVIETVSGGITNLCKFHRRAFPFPQTVNLIFLF